MEIQEFKTVLRAFKWMKGKTFLRVDNNMVFVYQKHNLDPIGCITRADNGAYFGITS